MSVPTLTPSAPSPGDRFVPARVAGALVHLPCPAWCVLDHVRADEGFLADVYHMGRSVELTAPVYGGTEQVLVAEVRQTPFGRNTEPYLCLDASGDGEVAELTSAQAVAFTDQLVAHAERIRSLARTIAD